MDKVQLSKEEQARLRRREAEIEARIGRLKRAMNETGALETLALKSKLFKEAQDELRRVQNKLAGLSED